MTHVRYVTIGRFEQLTGYTEDAVRSKIKRGEWLEDVVYKKAPDGRILMDLEGYESWVESTTVSEQLRIRQSKSTSTTAGRVAASG
jgi:hypothetical protein